MYTTQNAVKHLAENSDFLQEQQSDYLAISGDFDTVCFYETYQMSLYGLGHMTVGFAPSSVVEEGLIPLRLFHSTRRSFRAREM